MTRYDRYARTIGNYISKPILGSGDSPLSGFLNIMAI